MEMSLFTRFFLFFLAAAMFSSSGFSQVEKTEEQMEIPAATQEKIEKTKGIKTVTETEYNLEKDSITRDANIKF